VRADVIAAPSKVILDVDDPVDQLDRAQHISSL
jgi:hypothetical protein